MDKYEWSNGVHKLIEKLTSFNENNLNSSKKYCYNFLVDNYPIGYVRPDVLQALKQHYSTHFIINDDAKSIAFLNVHNDFNSRSEIMKHVVEDMKEKKLFKALIGWRNETYDIKRSFYSEKLFKLERSAVGLFGFLAFGCHINGYTKDEDGNYKLWISKRSATKQTYPNMFDNLSAGGLASGLKLHECAIKELEEESGVCGDLLKTLKSVNAITYAYENQYGISREGEFIFDIRLPATFIPKNDDGEAQSFYLMDVNQLKKAIISDDFKPNSALITLDFLMRHGLITPDEDENYFFILENIHASGY